MFLTGMSDDMCLAHIAGREAMLASAREREAKEASKIVELAAFRERKKPRARRTVPIFDQQTE